MTKKRRGKKTRKCQLCKLDDTILEDMEYETVGKNNIKKFYHKECFVEHRKNQEYLKKEADELDELKTAIEKLYGLEQLPHQAYPFLQNLRMGNPVFGNRQRTGKRYREGYSYLLIKETFEYCSETIEYWNGVKNFDGFMQAFKYALAIVIDKIYIVEQRVKQRESQNSQIEKHLENTDIDFGFETSYQKPKSRNTDITDFLDD